MSKRVYIAGPMTGKDNLNFPAFFRAANRVRDAGHTPILPIDEDEHEAGIPNERAYRAEVGGDMREEIIERDLRLLLDADGVALLSGWRESEGARLEARVAEATGRDLLDAETLEPIDSDETVLEEAQRIIHGDRNDFYGHPLDNHGTTAGMMRAYLQRKYDGEIPFDAEDVCVFHILEKLSRQANRPKRDNWTDIAGYAGNVEMIEKEKVRRRDLDDAEKHVTESVGAP